MPVPLASHKEQQPAILATKECIEKHLLLLFAV
jgi:hypothetical protein